MTIPNPHIAIADGYKTFTSGASSTKIPNPLLLAPFIAFIFYNLANLLAMDLSLIVDFSKPIYRASINWLNRIRTYSVISAQLHAALDRMLSPATKPDQAIAVEIVKVPGVGTLAMIRGLPSDLPAAQLSQFLETTLYCDFQPTLQPDLDAAPATEAPTTAPAQIDISSRGLWRGTCVQDVVGTSHLPAEGNPRDQTAGAATITPRTSSAQNNHVDQNNEVKEPEARIQDTDLYDGTLEDPLDIDAYTRD